MKGSLKKMGYDKMILNLKKNIKGRSIEDAINVAESVIANLGIKEYPVPIVKILNDLGFSIYATETNPNISGFILISPDLRNKFNTDRIIAVDRNDSYGRQRFTLAHEFAHFLFDFNEERNMQFINTYDINKADSDDERVPSRFAAELLMPVSLFTDRYRELRDLTQYERVRQLVSDFEVSQTAVSKRIKELEDKLGRI